MKNPKPQKHNLETLNSAIKSKNMESFLEAIEFDTHKVLLKDKQYGEYQVDLKSLAPKTNLPKHKLRKHHEKVEKFKLEYLGKKVNNITINEIFYGPDKGYKNRSFYLVYSGDCGHEGISTLARLKSNKKNFMCQSCSKTLHGERTRIDGVLKKRTPTYIYWTTHKKELPEKFKEFEVFKREVGDKPYHKAKLVLHEGAFKWISDEITEDKETNLIATAIRQAFRHSLIYKNTIEKSRVETEEGPRYVCASCFSLNKRTNIQVDHIDPINPVSGDSLNRNDLIARIWTDRVQVLDKNCHTKKSTLENKLRREHKRAKLIEKEGLNEQSPQRIEKTSAKRNPRATARIAKKRSISRVIRSTTKRNGSST